MLDSAMSRMAFHHAATSGSRGRTWMMDRLISRPPPQHPPAGGVHRLGPPEWGRPMSGTEGRGFARRHQGAGPGSRGGDRTYGAQSDEPSHGRRYPESSSLGEVARFSSATPSLVLAELYSICGHHPTKMAPISGHSPCKASTLGVLSAHFLRLALLFVDTRGDLRKSGQYLKSGQKGVNLLREGSPAYAERAG